MRILSILFMAAGAFAAAAEVKPPPPDKDFDARLKAYVELKRNVTKGLAEPPANSDPKLIEQRRTAAAQAISDARAGAKPGNLFTPAASAQIRRIIRSEMKGSDGKSAKDAAKTGNPVAEGTPFTPKVNAPYPASAPISMVPPTLLMRLPQLPQDIEYRFVGKTLILFDADARLILDLLPNAQP